MKDFFRVLGVAVFMKSALLSVCILAMFCILGGVLQSVEALDCNDYSYVGGEGVGNVSSLSNVVDSVANNQCIVVFDGLYSEYVRFNVSSSVFGRGQVVFSDQSVLEDEIFFIKNGGVVLDGLSFVGFSENAVVDAVKLEGVKSAISNCSFSGSLSRALYVKSSSSNVIFGNDFDCEGIFIFECCESENNLVYGNNFLQNSSGRLITTRRVIWNESYPIGGNYWVEFDEPSEGAFDEDRDGIADEPFDIHNQGIDYFPLMRPWGEQLPVARFSVGKDVLEDVVFDAAESFDRDGEVVNWSWAIGGGGDLYGPSVICSFASPGWYVVNLSVVDDDSYQNFCNKSVWIGPHKPAVDLNVSQNGMMVNVSAVILNEGCGITEILWDFGDGTDVSGGLQQSHTFEDSGVFVINVSVVDCLGAIGWQSVQLEVESYSEVESPGFGMLILCAALLFVAGCWRRRQG